MGKKHINPNRYQFRKGIVIILITQRCGKIRRCIIDEEDYKLCSKYHWSVCDNKKANNLTYAHTRKNGKRLVLHRLIYEKEAKGASIDHINHDGLDNRKANLRVATVAQNSYNQRPQTRKKTSKYKGVRYTKLYHLWEARIKKNGVYHALGFFDTSWKAAQAYNEAATKMFGNFACLNNITEEEKLLESCLTPKHSIKAKGVKTFDKKLVMDDWGTESIYDFFNPNFDYGHIKGIEQI